MADFVEFVRDQLRRLGPVTVRAMFGGHGLWLDGRIFGIVAEGALHLRTGPRNRAAYEALGLRPFKPWDDRPVTLKAYYPLPEDVLEDPDAAARWAREAVEAARDADAAKATKPRPAGTAAKKTAKKKPATAEPAPRRTTR